MVKPGHRSRSLRRVFVTTPGGENKLTHRKRKPSKAVCSNCKTELKGVANERPHKMQNIPKSKKRPERPFGGVLCSKCTRQKILKKSRASEL
jgi:large subunit ribosomal protein L34e